MLVLVTTNYDVAISKKVVKCNLSMLINSNEQRSFINNPNPIHFIIPTIN